MTNGRLPLAEAVARWDRAAYASGVGAQAERLRHQITTSFPLDGWPTLDLRRYALGTGEPQTFSWWMEFGAPILGSVGGGNAMKHRIFRKADGSWYFPEGFTDEQGAWETIREQLSEAFRLAIAGDFHAIGMLPQLQNGSITVAKAISIYAPDSMLPIFAKSHRDHFLTLLGGEGESDAWAWEGAHKLLEVARQHTVFADWAPLEISTFLYDWAHPVQTTSIVKIAPGFMAQYWQDCLEHGYIRVGWDEVGDLRRYSRDEFGAAFAEQYRDFYNGRQAKITEKANELWTLMELKPGDIVIANKGTSRIMGIGRVREPGYESRPDLGGFSQTVAVDWEDTTEREIEPIKRWAFKTIQRLSQADYQRILAGKGVSDGGGPQRGRTPVPVPSADPLLTDLDLAITRKGQAILYGPPGTGKTYNARRFSVWWLAKRDRDPQPERLLIDRESLQRAERRLSAPPGGGRVWWMVANPAQWSWDRLFADGTVDYRYGRLQRNFPSVAEGDLVVGYSSNPVKRIVALARVTQGLHETSDGQRISLAPLAPVQNGPTYEELEADATLRSSEPMRFRNQGSLFALTDTEADYLVSWLAERDPAFPSLDREASDGVGRLTKVTFHPSYSYEDFVEGYKPQGTGSGTLDLRLTDGVFKRLCRAAASDPSHDYLLLIDEINRGNIPKIFGELITLLERDKRDMTVVLPQSGETFGVPPNVYVLGTMNTADRSIRLLDAALRRRFAFIELMPDTEPLGGGRIGGLDLVVFLAELNSRVARIEGREKQIGQSFLLEDGEPVSDAARFALQFRHEILPLLQEYAYEDYRELAEYVGTDLVDVEAQRLRSEVLDDPDQLVGALVRHLMPGGSQEAEEELTGEPR